MEWLTETFNSLVGVSPVPESHEDKKAETTPDDVQTRAADLQLQNSGQLTKTQLLKFFEAGTQQLKSEIFRQRLKDAQFLKQARIWAAIWRHHYYHICTHWGRALLAWPQQWFCLQMSACISCLFHCSRKNVFCRNEKIANCRLRLLSNFSTDTTLLSLCNASSELRCQVKFYSRSRQVLSGQWQLMHNFCWVEVYPVA